MRMMIRLGFKLENKVAWWKFACIGRMAELESQR